MGLLVATLQFPTTGIQNYCNELGNSFSRVSARELRKVKVLRQISRM